jgi:imidazolonepropionase
VSAPARARGDIDIVNAASVVVVADSGAARRGDDQGEMNVISDASVIIRNGVIRAVGPTAAVRTPKMFAEWGQATITLDAGGKTVMPGLIDCHSHPLFGGHRHDEYAERLGGASLAEVAARGGGIWSSVVATRDADAESLLSRLLAALHRMLRGGVTCAEVKSGYGLTVDSELHQLDLLQQARSASPIELVISFLGAHVVPRDIAASNDESPADLYTDLVAGEMTDRVVAQGIAQFQDVTVEDGLFTPEQALRIIERSHALGLRTRVHADAWKPSLGWRTACAAGAISADHLTYTDDSEIDAVGATETVAVVLPVAELIYMTDRRANARRFIDSGVPLAISTDYCSSIHATSLLSTMTMAAPWFRISPAEAVVGATLNAAYSLGVQADRGSLDVGKRGDLLILDCPHPNELFLGLADEMLSMVIVDGLVRHRADGAASETISA